MSQLYTFSTDETHSRKAKAIDDIWKLSKQKYLNGSEEYNGKKEIKIFIPVLRIAFYRKTPFI